MTRGTTATLAVKNTSAKFEKLKTLKVIGANNTVTVRKGATKLSVRGVNNRVRVHRRR